jgi:hypothetical protein
MGQIVGMADSVQAIRVNQFSKCGRNIRDIMPYLHMNARTIFIEVYHVMCALLQKSGVRHSRANPFADIENLVRHLCDRGRILRNAVAMLDEILNYQDGTKQGDFLKIRKAVEPVAAMIRSSGLVRDEIFTWLETVRQSEHDSIIGDLTDMDLMQNELYWQLRRVCKVIGDCLDKDTVPSAPEPRNFLKGIVSQIEGFLDTGASR